MKVINRNKTIKTHAYLSMLEPENLHDFCFKKFAQEPNNVNIFYLPFNCFSPAINHQ